MGLAASQANFLALTGRKSDIGLELQRLSSNKEALARDMQKVTRNYKEALSTKSLKWSANNGVSYADLSYSTLMRPGGTADNSPYLITNSAGKVVISDDYKEYAEKIAQKGYDGQTRYEILSSVMKIPEDTLKLYDSTKADIDAKKALEDEASDAVKVVKYQDWSNEKIIDELLDSYNNKTDNLNAVSIELLSQNVQNALCGKGYFPANTEALIKDACEQQADLYKKSSDNESYKDYKAANFINAVLNHVKTTLGTNTIRVMIDAKNGNKGTQSEYEAASAAYKEAHQNYQSAVSANAEVLNGTQKKQIEFYDQLFQAIADMGYQEDYNITDADYLNQMFQNNSYYITTMVENHNYDENKAIDDRNYKFSYDTQAAENDPNIFKVNDSAAHEEALVKYEYEKSLINEKEKRIDTRMKNLETEQSAITKMLESIEKVKNDNVERTFNLWS